MAEWTPQLNLNRRFWVGCAVALLGVSFLVAAALQSSDVRTLSRQGIAVEAIVTDTRQTAPTNGTSDGGAYHLTYSFTANGQSITNQRRVPEQFYQTHPQGTTWAIRVAPNDPSVHDLYPKETKRTTWGLAAAAAILISIGGFFALSSGSLAAIRARF